MEREGAKLLHARGQHREAVDMMTSSVVSHLNVLGSDESTQSKVRVEGRRERVNGERKRGRFRGKGLMGKGRGEGLEGKG